MLIVSLNVREGSPFEPLMAFNYGHDYKMSQIFGECEQINRVLQGGEHKALKACLCQVSSLFPLSPTAGEPCSTRGLLAGWGGCVWGLTT